MLVKFTSTFCDLSIQGRLGRDIELRQSQAGNSYALVDLAYSAPKKIDGKWESETHWISAPIFGDSAEIASKHMHKGDLVLLRGRLTTSSYEGKIQLRVHVQSLTLILKREVTSAAMKSESTPAQGVQKFDTTAPFKSETDNSFLDDHIDDIEWDI